MGTEGAVWAQNISCIIYIAFLGTALDLYACIALVVFVRPTLGYELYEKSKKRNDSRRRAGKGQNLVNVGV